jgi:hypothetical protein
VLIARAAPHRPHVFEDFDDRFRGDSSHRILSCVEITPADIPGNQAVKEATTPRSDDGD